MMITTKFPCKDCTDRAVGCHGICQKYIAAKEQAELKKKDIRAEENLNTFLDTYQMETVRRVQKARHTRFKRR